MDQQLLFGVIDVGETPETVPALWPPGVFHQLRFRRVEASHKQPPRARFLGK